MVDAFLRIVAVKPNYPMAHIAGTTVKALFVGVYLPVVIEAITGLVEDKLNDRSPHLTVVSKSDYSAGTTVSDISIKNDGCCSLDGLVGDLVFVFPIKSVDIVPERANYTVTTTKVGTRLTIHLLDAIKPDKDITIRVISNGQNFMKGSDSGLAEHFTAHATIFVKGKSQFQYKWKGIIRLSELTLGIIGVVLIFQKLRKRQPTRHTYFLGPL
jgi:hypothetical protein